MPSITVEAGFDRSLFDKREQDFYIGSRSANGDIDEVFRDTVCDFLRHCSDHVGVYGSGFWSIQDLIDPAFGWGLDDNRAWFERSIKEPQMAFNCFYVDEAVGETTVVLLEPFEVVRLAEFAVATRKELRSIGNACRRIEASYRLATEVEIEAMRVAASGNSPQP